MVQKAYFYAIGKRKTSRATVKMFPGGKGEMKINDLDPHEWNDNRDVLRTLWSPLELLGLKKDFDFEIRTSGGGKTAQADSIRLGIARVLVKKEPKFREQMKNAGFLSRDPRIKERKKPGLKKARRAPQFSKR